MGLDISHLQLSLTPNENNDFLNIDDWDADCNVPLENYSKYITTIDDLEFNKTLAIFKNEADFEMLKKANRYEDLGYLKVFIGEQTDHLRYDVSKYATKHKLDKLEKIVLITEQEGIKYHTISFGEAIKVQGVYYKDDVGYQRKGMSNLFYDHFKKNMLWGRKEDFELAYTCVADEWYLKHWGAANVAEMRANFKENFVDKFEFGKSLLCVSF